MIRLSEKLNISYEELKKELYSSLEWHGINLHHIQYEQRDFCFQKNYVGYNVQITIKGYKKSIMITATTPVPLKKLYHYLGDIRRYEYLQEGAFYKMTKCLIDNRDATEIIDEVELGYFQSEGAKHKISLNLSDKEYKKYFLKWLKLQSKLGIINQMALFANCVKGIPADMRISMISECYEAIGKRLEKAKQISVKPLASTFRLVNCPKCKKNYKISIPGKKTFISYMLAIIETYGKPIFSNEFRRRKSLVRRIVGTRNKVFHVNEKQKKKLTGKQCGFYTIKLEWLFRYVIWIQMGVPVQRLNEAVEKEIVKFEEKFPQLIY